MLSGLNPAMARSTHQCCDLAFKLTKGKGALEFRERARLLGRRARTIAPKATRKVRTPPQTTALGSARRRRILAAARAELPKAKCLRRRCKFPFCKCILAVATPRQPLQAELVPLHRTHVAHGRRLAHEHTFLASRHKTPLRHGIPS